MRRYYEEDFNEDYELGYERGRRDALRELEENKSSLPDWLLTQDFYIIDVGNKLMFASMRSDKDMLIIKDEEVKEIFGSKKVESSTYRKDLEKAIRNAGITGNIHYCSR